MYKWLDMSLDLGITEREFWDMTYAELERAVASKKRVARQQQKDRAAFDYILAETIGRSVARVYSASAQMPPIHAVYPSLFQDAEVKKNEEAKREAQSKLDAIKFRLFVDSFNKRFQGGGKRA